MGVSGVMYEAFRPSVAVTVYEHARPYAQTTAIAIGQFCVLQLLADVTAASEALTIIASKPSVAEL